MVALAHTQDLGGSCRKFSSGRADERKEGGIAAVSPIGNSTFLTLKAQSSPPRGSLTFLSRRTLLPHSGSTTHLPTIPVIASSPGCVRIRHQKRRLSHGIWRQGKSKNGNPSHIGRD